MSDLAGDAPRHLHPTWIIYSAIQSLRALIVPIVVMLVSGGNLWELFGFGITIGIAIIVVGARVLIWQRFTYQIDERGIRVDSGLVSRQERFLPTDRIQAVDINENVLHRLLGVVSLRIESAAGAGSGADITLDALSRAEGERLRRRLLDRRIDAVARDVDVEAIAIPESTGEGELLARAPFGRLLVAGMTSGRIGPAAGLIVGGLQFVDDILPSGPEEWVKSAVPAADFQGILLAIALCGLAAWLFAIGSTLLTFGAFELRRVDNRLQATYGLLERRRVSIPIARVQAVTITEGLLRQPFGLAAIRAESAGYGKDTAESGVLMPIIRRRDIPGFMANVLPAYSVDLDQIEMHGPPRRAMRRYVLGPVWGWLTIAAIVAIANAVNDARTIVDRSIPWEWMLVAAPIFALAAALGWLRYCDDGWLVDDNGRVVIRGRPLHRVTTVTSTRRIQHRSLIANPLQRRADLTSFSAAVASGGGGGGLGIAHLDRADAERLYTMLGRTSPAGHAITA